jgi:hypothetical protein
MRPPPVRKNAAMSGAPAGGCEAVTTLPSTRAWLHPSRALAHRPGCHPRNSLRFSLHLGQWRHAGEAARLAEIPEVACHP